MFHKKYHVRKYPQIRSCLEFLLTRIVPLFSDPDYLNKTMHDRGSFKRCDDVTCGNYGNCTAVGHERFTCTCHPQYAGRNLDMP